MLASTTTLEARSPIGPLALSGPSASARRGGVADTGWYGHWQIYMYIFKLPGISESETKEPTKAPTEAPSGVICGQPTPGGAGMSRYLPDSEAPTGCHPAAAAPHCPQCLA